jgi:mRNA-degrading endonuclease toxin of MazEF toxin-antitoxin module
MKRGEIRWSAPEMVGSARKRRPFLVISDDVFNANERYPKVMVVHLTSVRRLGGPYDWEVDVPRGVARLQKGSVIKCGEIYTLLKIHLGDLVGTLPRAYLDQVDAALSVALGLSTGFPPQGEGPGSPRI